MNRPLVERGTREREKRYFFLKERACSQANVGGLGVLFTLDILSQACEKHIQTRFCLYQFRFWNITQPIM